MSDLSNAEIPSAEQSRGDGGDVQQRVDPTPTNGRSASTASRSHDLKPHAREAAPLLDLDQAQRHARMVGIPEAEVDIRALHWNGGKAEDVPQAFSGAYEEGWLEGLQRRGYSLYLNAGGERNDERVARIPCLFVEFDGLTVKEVEEWMGECAAAGLPDPTLVLTTWREGSTHYWWRLAEPCTDIERWRRLMKRLTVALGSDTSCTNPSRVMRLAGSSYIQKAGKEKGGGPKGGSVLGQATILDSRSDEDATTTLGEMEVWVDNQFATRPELKDRAKESEALAVRGERAGLPQADDERPTTAKGELRPARPLEQIEAALAAIPRRVSGTGGPHDYSWYRGVLLGLRDALYRLTEGAEAERIATANQQALARMEKHSPSRECNWNIREVLKTSLWMNEGVFWKRAKDAGWEAPPRKPLVSDLQAIRDGADFVVNEDVNRSRPQMLHRLRELVEGDLTCQPSSELYRREIGDAIHRRDGIAAVPFRGGGILPDDDDEWFVRDLIMFSALNLITADPKAGKTLLVLHLLAVLLHDCQEFLGGAIEKRPATVIIVGPDQPIRLWKKGLRKIGLVDGHRLDPRVVRIWDSTNPWTATYEGMAELRQTCMEFPGSLVVFDSFGRITEALGIEENTKEASEVLTDIELACITYGCTPLVIAHNAKAATANGIVSGHALRGHSSIRSKASQILIMSLVQPKEPKNKQRRLVTEGRGDEPQDMVIRLEPEPLHWVREGEFAAYAMAEKEQKTLQTIPPGQRHALAAVKHCGGLAVPLRDIWKRIYPGAEWDCQSSSAKGLRDTINALVKKKLLEKVQLPNARLAWSLTELCAQLPGETWALPDAPSGAEVDDADA